MSCNVGWLCGIRLLSLRAILTPPGPVLVSLPPPLLPSLYVGRMPSDTVAASAATTAAAAAPCDARPEAVRCRLLSLARLPPPRVPPTSAASLHSLHSPLSASVGSTASGGSSSSSSSSKNGAVTVAPSSSHCRSPSLFAAVTGCDDGDSDSDSVLPVARHFTLDLNTPHMTTRSLGRATQQRRQQEDDGEANTCQLSEPTR